ncbi:MaoC family dehydratase N-terminal domain-containing protein [Planococcus shixiaomingii]|uniref:MaoC family dehydratase N-terminal domain-containing protein n=1 Tax=Planococcus shixiaomingii TaxID=3058393 RepID=UPI00261E0EEA|nr:MaoC family dehydratase N-terminal domain-containing protein [Planococcus sp. N022]WKA55085.1 MaoC family dehydratase N-terminal domain-containing protein [Planococcus sp. N022]
MLKSSIGKKSNKVKNTIERGAVRKFAEAINDPDPIYLDETAGANSRYKRNIAPPTFPVTFDAGTIPDMNLPAKGLIHGEQIYHYKRPLYVGEDVYCWMEVKDYYEKSGNFGDMGFLVVGKYGEDEDGTLLFTEERIVIINEAARKEMVG